MVICLVAYIKSSIFCIELLEGFLSTIRGFIWLLNISRSLQCRLAEIINYFNKAMKELNILVVSC